MGLGERPPRWHGVRPSLRHFSTPCGSTPRGKVTKRRSDPIHTAGMIRVRHCLAIILIAAPLCAQAPSEHWKTIATPHFRIHYPQRYEAWTERAAAHIESVRAAVVREVGYAPETVTDIVVMNPIAEPNGVTLPLLGHPRILLFTEPPGPEVQIGEYSNWIDLLTVHEMTHLVHLLRPSRNRTQRMIEHILPLNPITLA